MTLEQRAEMDAEFFSRQDYLSEAYGAEARLLDAQARDEYVFDNGFFSAAGMRAAEREHASRRAASEAIRNNKPSIVGVDADIPF